MDNPLRLDPNFDGSCACSKFEKDYIKIETHCWRSSCEQDHEYSCVHYSPDTAEAFDLAIKTAQYIREAYLTQVTIHKEDSQ